MPVLSHFDDLAKLAIEQMPRPCGSNRAEAACQSGISEADHGRSWQ